MSFAALLDQKLNLERQTVTPDGSGGSSRSYSAIASNVPCAVSPASASVVADYARLDMLVNYSVYTTTDLDALTGGVIVGDRLTNGSVYYLVKAVKKSANAVIATEILYQLDCELRR
jgi:hypothetical protein